MQKALKGADHPVGSDDLGSLARSNGAGGAGVKRIARSGAKQFDGLNDMRKAVFGDDQDHFPGLPGQSPAGTGFGQGGHAFRRTAPDPGR